MWGRAAVALVAICMAKLAVKAPHGSVNPGTPRPAGRGILNNE